MKFESKFGLGEIVSRTRYKGDEIVADELYEVVAVAFDGDGNTAYSCRAPKGALIQFSETEIEGDPNFDQEAGCYKEAS